MKPTSHEDSRHSLTPRGPEHILPISWNDVSYFTFNLLRGDRG